MSPRKKKTTSKSAWPTESEQEILQILWKLKSATVREVHDVLTEIRDVRYTTVLKQMQIMFEKNLVVRDETQRSHIYRARQKAETTQRQLVGDFMTRVFGGAADKLVMQALNSKKTSPEEIANIRKLLDKLEEKQK